MKSVGRKNFKEKCLQVIIYIYVCVCVCMCMCVCFLVYRAFQHIRRTLMYNMKSSPRRYMEMPTLTPCNQKSKILIIEVRGNLNPLFDGGYRKRCLIKRKYDGCIYNREIQCVKILIPLLIFRKFPNKMLVKNSL